MPLNAKCRLNSSVCSVLRLHLGFLLITASLTMGQTIGLDYGKLSARQQSLFQGLSGCSPSTCPQEWQKLTSSEELEFAGGTQALGTVQLEPPSTYGLDAVQTVWKIDGSEPSQPSQYQFNVETNWEPSAPNQFKHVKGWSNHIAILHKGQYGYQENREGDPFLGLVVLFNKKPTNPSRPQFHIDFRSWFAHYCPDNGNVAANYDEYVEWYGKISGYSPLFRFVFTDLAKKELSPDTFGSANSRNSSVCSSDIKKVVERFLTTWYVEQDFSALLDFVARDNVYNAANLEGLGVRTPSALWLRLFSDAFESSSTKVSKLENILQFHEPDFGDTDTTLHYLNQEEVKSGGATYAIIEPKSVPSGSLFPATPATDKENVHWNIQARFLDHLREEYHSKIYVVVYAVIGPDLVHETAVQYWIEEGDCWKISAFQGTDW
jgi:hypothetical protein